MPSIITALPWHKGFPLRKHSCFEIQLVSAYKTGSSLMKKNTPPPPQNHSLGIQESNIYFWWCHFTFNLLIYKGPPWLPAFNLKSLAPSHGHSTSRKTDLPTSSYPWSPLKGGDCLAYHSSPTTPCSTLNSPLLSRNDLNCTWYLTFHATFLLRLF